MRDISVTSPILSSLSKCLSQLRSQDVEAFALYFASTLDLATTFYFLPFQVIKLLSIKTQYAEVDLMSIGKLAQNA